MNEPKIPRGRPSRRTFLTGLLTGAGVAAALGTTPRSTAATTGEAPASADHAKGAVLYRRTPEVERYYRSLHRS